MSETSDIAQKFHTLSCTIAEQLRNASTPALNCIETIDGAYILTYPAQVGSLLNIYNIIGELQAVQLFPENMGYYSDIQHSLLSLEHEKPYRNLPWLYVNRTRDGNYHCRITLPAKIKENEVLRDLEVPEIMRKLEGAIRHVKNGSMSRRPHLPEWKTKIREERLDIIGRYITARIQQHQFHPLGSQCNLGHIGTDHIFVYLPNRAGETERLAPVATELQQFFGNSATIEPLIRTLPDGEELTLRLSTVNPGQALRVIEESDPGTLSALLKNNGRQRG
jgi:hypothetical protein